jgi:hypothetical protein
MFAKQSKYYKTPHILQKISKKLFKNKITLTEENIEIHKYPVFVQLKVMGEGSNIKNKTFYFGK